MAEKRNIILVTADSLYFENAISLSVGIPSSLSCIFTGELPLVKSTETRPDPWRKLSYAGMLPKQINIAYVLT